MNSITRAINMAIDTSFIVCQNYCTFQRFRRGFPKIINSFVCFLSFSFKSLPAPIRHQPLSPNNQPRVQQSAVTHFGTSDHQFVQRYDHFTTSWPTFTSASLDSPCDISYSSSLLNELITNFIAQKNNEHCTLHRTLTYFKLVDQPDGERLHMLSQFGRTSFIQKLLTFI